MRQPAHHTCNVIRVFRDCTSAQPRLSRSFALKLERDTVNFAQSRKDAKTRMRKPLCAFAALRDHILWCILLPVLLSVVAATNSDAADFLHVNGARLTRADSIVTQVTGASGNTAMVALGYAYGIDNGKHLLIMREINGKFAPINVLRVTRTNHASAMGVGLYAVRIRRHDKAVIAVRDLDLWDYQNRIEEQTIRRILNRAGRNGYDTKLRNIGIMMQSRADRQRTRQDALTARNEGALKKYDSVRESLEGPRTYSRDEVGGATSRSRRAVVRDESLIDHLGEIGWEWVADLYHDYYPGGQVVEFDYKPGQFNDAPRPLVRALVDGIGGAIVQPEFVPDDEDATEVRN